MNFLLRKGKSFLVSLSYHVNIVEMGHLMESQDRLNKDC